MLLLSYYDFLNQFVGNCSRSTEYEDSALTSNTFTCDNVVSSFNVVIVYQCQRVRTISCGICCGAVSRSTLKVIWLGCLWRCGS